MSFIYIYIINPPCHFMVGGDSVVNQPFSLQNGSGTQSPSYKMVCQ